VTRPADGAETACFAGTNYAAGRRWARQPIGLTIVATCLWRACRLGAPSGSRLGGRCPAGGGVCYRGRGCWQPGSDRLARWEPGRGSFLGENLVHGGGAELEPWAAREPLAPAVARLGCYRGIAELTGLVLAAEVVDWRRFPSARAFMGFTGLVPAEYSSGERTPPRLDHQGRVGARPDRADRGRLGLPVPAQGRRHPAPQPARRPPDTLARSWRAQRRLYAKYKTMTARGKPAGVAVTAMARELAGFAWAEMTS
jgi:Transposase IS116/IS110/IS902 family